MRIEKCNDKHEQERLRASVLYLRSKKKDYDRAVGTDNRAEKSLICYMIRQMIKEFDLTRYDAYIQDKSTDIDFFINFVERICRKNISPDVYSDGDKASGDLPARIFGPTHVI